MSKLTAGNQNCFNRFEGSIDDIELPEKFTFPFFYQPHPISLLAAKELQDYIETQTEWEYDFGMNAPDDSYSIGKMFGVLVVQNQEGELGYLAAFSGKLANSNSHSRFVPPVFDTLDELGFLNIGMKELGKINLRVDTLSNNPRIAELRALLAKAKETAASEIENAREGIRVKRKERKVEKEHARATFEKEQFDSVLKDLIEQSLRQKNKLKYLIHQWDEKVQAIQSDLNNELKELNELKAARKKKSNGLQQQLFESYSFLNIKGEVKDLLDIFKTTVEGRPKSGAGECAAPKLLQYAFQNNLKPISMAEYWWGRAPKSEIRKHGHFYASCKSKCEPILGHMLDGMEVDDNPLLKPKPGVKPIEIIYEDDDMWAINKPADLLSVPGKTPLDSVYDWMKRTYPKATGPLVVHRLDMATSGIMLLGKTAEACKNLQRQFIKRSIKKRYVALLDGVLDGESGLVDLPLRNDLEDRPRQLVCHEHGKKARTEWVVIQRNKETTRVHFTPITGRTHQLRVHASHQDGLNTPIKGDDLYGTQSDRLYLHAEWIAFEQPITKKTITLMVKADF